MKKHQVDLVLMDQHMPEIDGPEATRQLRKKGFECPILAFTASNDSDDRSEMLDAGCNGSIDKPVNLEQLYETLCQYLPESSSQQPTIKQLIHEIPKLTQSMNKALDERDWALLQSLAHEIIEISSSFGFKEISASAKRVERALQKDNTKHIKKLFNTFKGNVLKAETQFK